MDKILERLVSKKFCKWIAIGTIFASSLLPLRDAHANNSVSLRWTLPDYPVEMKGYILESQRNGGRWEPYFVPHGDCANGKCEKELDVKELSTYNFRVRAVAENGNESDFSETISYVTGAFEESDTTPPEISVDSYPKNTDLEQIVLTGSIYDDSHVTLHAEIDGVSDYIRSGSGDWEYTVDIPEGGVVVNLKGEDYNDNIAYKSLEISDDVTPPDAFAEFMDGSLDVSSNEQVSSDVYVNNNFVGNYANDFNANIPLRHLQDGVNDFEVMVEDEAGNTTVIDKQFYVEKGFTLLEDGEYDNESQIPWTNSSYISLDDNAVEGQKSLRFDLSGIPPGERRSWDLYLDEPYDMDDTLEQRLSVYLPRQMDITPYIYFHGGDGWYRHRPELGVGWNDVVLPNDSAALEGSNHDARNIDAISLVAYNDDDSTLESGDSINVDEFLGFKPIPVVEIEKYRNATEVQEDWQPVGEAETPLLAATDEGKALYLPADLSGDYYRGYWVKALSNFDFSKVEQFRLRTGVPNPDNELGYQFYFQNEAGTYFKFGGLYKNGKNDILMNRDEFGPEGGTDHTWNNIANVICSTTRRDGYPSEANIIVEGIGINDLFYTYEIQGGIINDVTAPTSSKGIETHTKNSIQGLEFSLDYNDESEVTAEVFSNDSFVGTFNGENSSLQIKMPLKDIKDGNNNFEIILADQYGNTSEFTKELFIKKGYNIIEDAEYAYENDIPWTNRYQVSLDEGIVAEGQKSLKFELGGLAPHESRNWELPLQDNYDMSSTTEQRAMVFVPSAQDIEAIISLHGGEGWYKHSLRLEKGWNEIKLPNKEAVIEGSNPNPEEINKIRLEIVNGDSYLPNDFSINMDQLVGYEPIPVVDLQKYNLTSEVQDEWIPVAEAKPAQLVEGEGEKSLYLPADLSGDYYRGYWKKGLPNVDYSTVNQFRLVTDIEKPDNVLGYQFYFRNASGTYFKYGGLYNNGENDILMNRVDFGPEGGTDHTWDNIVNVLCSTTRRSGYPEDANITLKDISINDLLFYKK